MSFTKTALCALLLGAAATAQAASAGDADRAAKGEAKLAKILEGRVPGKPVSCLPQNQIDSSQIVDRTAIVYRVGSTLYVNRPEIGADSLSWDPILVTDTRTSQLCNIDTVRLLDRNNFFQRGFVGLGQFVPYRKP